MLETNLDESWKLLQAMFQSINPFVTTSAEVKRLSTNNNDPTQSAILSENGDI
ncbi:MAG: hypothetical protein ACPG8W_20950 [Candidatus Promineifilaceae bacterium]